MKQPWYRFKRTHAHTHIHICKLWHGYNTQTPIWVRVRHLSLSVRCTCYKMCILCVSKHMNTMYFVINSYFLLAICLECNVVRIDRPTLRSPASYTTRPHSLLPSASRHHSRTPSLLTLFSILSSLIFLWSSFSSFSSWSSPSYFLVILSNLLLSRWPARLILAAVSSLNVTGTSWSYCS